MYAVPSDRRCSSKAHQIWDLNGRAPVTRKHNVVGYKFDKWGTIIQNKYRTQRILLFISYSNAIVKMFVLYLQHSGT